MSQRVRSRDVKYAPGKLDRYTKGGVRLDGATSGSTQSEFYEITDRVDEGRFKSLNVRKMYSKGDPLLYGKAELSNSDYYAIYNGFKPANLGAAEGISNPAPSFSNLPTVSALATKLLAETNPSRPDVDMPLFLYELKELPDLIRREGSTILKSVAESNLQLQFGWMPLLGDLRKILGFTKMADDRYKELIALRDGGIRRKRTLESLQTSAELGSAAFHSQKVQLYANRTKVSKVNAWGYVEWYPDSGFPQSNEELRDKAWRLSQGVEGLSWSTAWNAMPWSWMADWWANTGDFLAANRNHLPVKYRNLVIMRQGYSETTIVPSGTQDWPPGYRSTFVHELKTRTPATPALQLAGLPCFSARQFSILGSLAILRRPNRSYIRNG
jgi:hypothetical protein